MGNEMLTIKVTTGHCLGGEGNDVYPGKVLVAPRDITLEAALMKVRRGYAVVIPNAPEPDPGPAPELPCPGGDSPSAFHGDSVVENSDPAIENRDPVVENGDPAIEKRDPVDNAPAAELAPTHKGRPRAGGR